MRGTCNMLSAQITNRGEISLGRKLDSFTNAEENVTCLGLSRITKTRKEMSKQAGKSGSMS